MTIDQKYTQLGGAGGFLGKPASAETVCPDQTGHFRHYQHGSIYWTPATDAHEVHGAIRDLWTALGWELSWLGYPTSDEQPEAGGGRVSFFQNGFIDWSAAAGAVDRANLQFQAYHRHTHAQHQQAHDKLKPLGWRMTALTVYGSSPLYGAVWVKQSGPSWAAIHGATDDQYQAFVSEWTEQNFRPTLVAATGSGSSAVFAAVMEKTSGPIPVSRHGLTPDEFKSWCAWAVLNNFILTTAAVYGDSGDPRIIAVWDLNVDNTAWNADSLLLSFDDTQATFDAQVGHESRLYEIIPSAYNSWLALYRGDAVGPGHTYLSLSPDDYQTTFEQRVAQGFFPASLHGAGDSDGGAVIAPIFTKRAAPLPKRWVATGAAVPSLALFDEQMQGYMQRNDIRNGTLAIAKDSKLVYARAFTWAEPGYPIAQPTDMFRVGSCSKCLTTILIHQLIQEKKLSRDDFAKTTLALTPPPQQTVVNKQFSKYRIWHLLSHQSGIAANFASADADIVALFGKQLPIKSKWEIASWLMTQKKMFDVGAQFTYANSGFLVLAAVVEKLRGAEWFKVFHDHVMKPLGLTKCAVSGSLLSQRAPGEVLYHDNGLGVSKSLMTADQPLVHDAYGNVNLAVGEGVGGMALCAAEYVKIMAALDLKKGDKNPVLHQDTVDKMWAYPNTIGQNAGYGNGWGGWQTAGGVQAWGHGGALSNCHATIEHRMDGYSLCVAFNAGQRQFEDTPDWDDLIDSAPDWPTTDLFPSLGIPAL